MFSHLMKAEISHRIGGIGLGIVQRLNVDLRKIFKSEIEQRCRQTKTPRSVSACAFRLSPERTKCNNVGLMGYLWVQWCCH